jgi:uncharacterized protein (DUF1499 family)
LANRETNTISESIKGARGPVRRRGILRPGWEEFMASMSSVAVWSNRVAIAALVLFLLGPVLGQMGAPGPGFMLFAVGGVLLSLVAVLLGAGGLWATRASTERGGRRQARLGAVIGLVLLVTTLAVARTSSVSKGGAAELPRINDITTNPADPPSFAKIAVNTGTDMAYPGPEFAEQQRQAYPDLAPIQLTVPPGKAFQQCRDTAVALGWEIVDQDPMSGSIEAMDSTAIFRFVDDIVIRLRPAATGGTTVDLRSRSRVGRGDLGANAGRIRAFRDALEG